MALVGQRCDIMMYVTLLGRSFCRRWRADSSAWCCREVWRTADEVTLICGFVVKSVCVWLNYMSC